MWQKRADTDSLLHKTFRDLAEKEVSSNEKKNSKPTHCPNEPVVFWCIFLDQSNLKIQSIKMKSQNNSSFSCVGCPICALSFSI